MKKFLITLALFSFGFYFTQVGINTVAPQGVLHIDGAKDKPTSGLPTTAQQTNDLAFTPAGNLGTISPNAKPEVKGKVSVSPDGTGADLSKSTFKI